MEGEKTMPESKKSDAVICYNCGNCLIVKEVTKDKIVNKYKICVLDHRIDCESVTECNKWKLKKLLVK